MGSDQLLIYSYRRYKRGTDDFLRWLTDTARKTEKFPELSSPERTSRNQNGNKRVGSASSKSEYTISTSRLVQLAKAIALNTSQEVPADKMEMLQDVIRVRKECAAFYLSNCDSNSTVPENHVDGHQHFILVLQEIYHILLPLKETKIPIVNREEETHNHDRSHLPNQYRFLQVWDCEAETPLKDPTSKAREEKETPRQFKLEEPPQQERNFALFCFLNDLAEIRLFVQKLWRAYASDKQTLNTVAVTANTAIAVIQRLNEEFVSAFPQFEEHRNIIKIFVRPMPDSGNGENHAETKYDRFVGANKDCGNHAKAEHNDYLGKQKDYENLNSAVQTRFESSSDFPYCCWIRYVLCECTTAYIESSINNDSVPMNGSHKARRKHRIQSVEAEIFKSLITLGTLVDRMRSNREKLDKCHIALFQDQIMRALSAVWTTKKVPTWTVFAIQFLADAREKPKYGPRNVWSEFQKEIECLLEYTITYQRNLNTIRPPHKLHFPKIKLLDDFVQRMNMVYRPDYISTLMGDFQGAALPIHGITPNLMLQYHPILCGILLQGYLVDYQILATELENELGAIRSVIHLKHAAQLFRPTPDWRDLDCVSSHPEDSYLFVGERPRELSHCFRHMALSCGYSMLEILRIKRLGIEHAAVRSMGKLKTPRPFQPIAFYVKSFREWDKSAGSQYSYAALDPSILLARALAKEVEDQELLEPEESLAVFHKILKYDDFQLRFDLLGLNWRCIELLRKMQMVCVYESPDVYPENKCGRDLSFSDIVLRMFHGVSCGLGEKLTRFNECCLLLDAVADRDGAAEITKLRLSQRIPQRLWSWSDEESSDQESSTDESDWEDVSDATGESDNTESDHEPVAQLEEDHQGT